PIHLFPLSLHDALPISTRAGAGMGCIDISRWSCWPIVFWRASAGCLPTRWAFPFSGERLSFPAVHRQVLVWLFQDVVLWLMATRSEEHTSELQSLTNLL